MTMKCAVTTCPNRSDEGRFEGFLCVPCSEAIQGRGGLPEIARVIESALRGIQQS